MRNKLGITGPAQRSKNSSRGSTLRGPSSIGLGWNGFAIERHSIAEDEKPEQCSDHHFIALWELRSCHGERAIDPNDRFIPYRRRPGVVSLFAAGIIPAVRNFTRMDVIVGGKEEPGDQAGKLPRVRLAGELNRFPPVLTFRWMELNWGVTPSDIHLTCCWLI